ncbi:hypothetical protein EPICR_100079 [Candidatus Desulfarcum epimagneticum]|uniref:Carrier domain-containing protein n=1 Tax=uncultured Desulfobacteraceae bacterium TaxID=218296 RepID=A0A484HCN4_9BACT|nr:hypothetical protein EPICR_100079 [uncultured Desulfobacteraceae bacterium]
MKPITLAVSGTFTTEPLEGPLAFWMEELGIPCHIHFTPYNQVFQQLLDPSGAFLNNRTGINIVLIRLEDWRRSEGAAGGNSSHSEYEDMEQKARELAAALGSAREKSEAPFFLFVCPASPEVTEDPAFRSISGRVKDLLAAEIGDISGVHILDSSELFDLYPVENYHDPHGDETGRIPFTETFFTALGTFITRKARALLSRPCKVIALDCDQTLWKGTIGEDGVRGVSLDPPRTALQNFMVARHDEGKLICLCSKNNEADVARAFRERPDMPLKREHIVSWRVNWRPKSENIRSLAKELDLGLDSFIFLDDNPLECAEVRARVPEVLTLQLPENPDHIERFLKHVWAFDQTHVTDEDRKRTALYKTDTRRNHFRKESPALKDFLAGLELDVKIAPLSPDRLPRVAQLTLRTTQFNAAPLGRSENEIKGLCEKDGFQCLTVEAGDRFGDYGLVGAMIFDARADSMDVGAFLLSCRALGRGIEHRMLAALGEIAHQNGLGHVSITYRATERNRPVLDFLESAGEAFKTPLEDGFLFAFPAQFAQSLVYDPDADEPNTRASDNPSEPVPKSDGAAASWKNETLNRIASEMHDSATILEKIRGKRKQSKTKEIRTKIEKALAAHPHIRDVAVRAREDVTDHDRLIAYVVADPQRSPAISGKRRYLLPNGMAIAHQNQVETDFIYREVFEKMFYLKHGITLNDGDSVIDIGAHIGLFSILAQQLFKDLKIYAFEPAPPTFELLRINAGLYASNVKLFNHGVSDRGKTASLRFYSVLPENSSYYPVTESGRKYHKIFIRRQLRIMGEKEVSGKEMDRLVERAFEYDTFETPMRPLSDILFDNNIQQVDLLKIDAEKSELDILRGIKTDDWKKIHQIVMEIHSKKLLDQIIALLKAKNYTLNAIQDTFAENSELFMLYASQNLKDEDIENHSIPLSNPDLLSGDELRDFVKRHVPNFVAPLDITFTDALPDAVGGEPDIHMFPAPDEESSDFDRAFAPPATSTEKTLAEIWANVLEVKVIGVNDDFFTLGGHSMLGVMLASRVLESFGVELPLTAVFEYPTVAKMADLIEIELISMLDPEELKNAMEELDGMSDDEVRKLLEKEEK